MELENNNSNNQIFDLNAIEFGFGNVELSLAKEENKDTYYVGAHGKYKLVVSNAKRFSRYFVKDNAIRYDELRNSTINIIRYIGKQTLINITSTNSDIQILDDKKLIEYIYIDNLKNNKALQKLGLAINAIILDELCIRDKETPIPNIISSPTLSPKKKNYWLFPLISLLVIAFVISIIYMPYIMKSNEPFDPELAGQVLYDEANKIEYTINNDGTLTLTNACISISHLTVPSSFKGYNVTTIGVGAFCGAIIDTLEFSEGIKYFKDSIFISSKVNHIIFPSTLTSFDLSQNPFRFNRTQSYYIPKSNKYFKTEDNGKFIVSKDGKELYAYASGVTDDYPNIPSGVEIIHNQVFSDAQFENIIIPNGVKTIHFSLFLENKCIKSVYIPESVTFISGAIFAAASNLETVTVDPNNPVYKSIDNIIYEGEHIISIPEKMTQTDYTIPKCTDIRAGALIGNKTIKHVFFQNGIKVIHSQSFIDCNNLETIYIPSSIQELVSDIFEFYGNHNQQKTIYGSGNKTLIKFTQEWEYPYIDTIIQDDKIILLDVILNGQSYVQIPEKIGPYDVVIDIDHLNLPKDVIIYCSLGGSVEKFARENGYLCRVNG